jgi:hypothetical protein
MKEEAMTKLASSYHVRMTLSPFKNFQMKTMQFPPYQVSRYKENLTTLTFDHQFKALFKITK